MSADQQREMARVKALAITFGAELRCRRQATGLQQRDLANRIGYDRSYVSQVESGRQVPAEQFAVLCERELATGGVLLDMFRELLAERESQRQAQHVERWRAKTAKGGDVAQPAKAFGRQDVWHASGDAVALPSPVESAEDSDTGAAVPLDGGTITNRRDALLLGIRLGGLVISENMLELLGTEPLELVRALGTSSASARTVDYFEVTAESLMVDYELSGPISLFKPTFQHFRQIRQLIQERQSPALQLRLCRPAAQLATLMGIFTYEDKVRARAWFHAAQRAADEAGDNGLHAWALVKESLIPLYGANPREALDLLGKADQLIGQTASVVSAMVAASQARAHASLGDERESQAAIQQAVTALDHSTPADQHLFAFSAPQLAFYETTSHLRLGRSAEAQESGRRALPLYEATPHYMDPALVRFDIATSFVQQKEIEEACRIGRQALDIRAEHQTGPIIQRARELRRALKPYSDQASVRDFDELLACV